MIKAIIKFFTRLNPDVIVQAPSRINLINPLDAVEGDFWMPSVAINGKENPLSAFLYIKKINTSSKIKVYEIIGELKSYDFEVIWEENLTREIITKKKFLNSEIKLIFASIYRFYRTNSLFKEKIFNQNLEIGLISTIPRQSGLGDSAAIIIATLYGFAEFFNLYNCLSGLKEHDFPINRDIIAEMATKVEDEDLKITAGYADRYLISRGGLAFVSYQGKLYHRELGTEPLAIYDRIDNVYEIDDLPIIVCYSGVNHESGDIHMKLRELYLQNDPHIINNYKKLAEIAWKSRFTLMTRDWKLLGEYFKINTDIMNNVMKHAGFEHGIGLANNILIKLIENRPNVYAAKLSGAGGGGSVFALVNPEKINEVLKEWKYELNSIINDEILFKKKFPNYPIEIKDKLKNVEFYRIKINKTGVKKIL